MRMLEHILACVTPDPNPLAEKQKRKRNHSEDDDGATCSICVEGWTNGGDHRLVALNCGHLFGRSCVERWLSSHKSCPTCKTTADIADIRCIHANKVVAVDYISELEAMKERVKSANAEKNLAEIELQNALMQRNSFLYELINLRKELKSGEKECFRLQKNVDLGRTADSKVMTYNCRKNELYISSKSTNAMIPGYCIVEINCLDFKLNSFTTLHSKSIRDLSYSQANDLILSASFDKTAKLISGQDSYIVNTIISDTRLLCCCWDFVTAQTLYIGGNNGFCYEYDKRNTSTYVRKFHTARDTSPVISLASTEEGFISCHSNSCTFYSRENEGRFKETPLHIQGPFSSLNYDSKSDHILISTRPSQRNINVKHILCYIDSKDMQMNVNTVHTFFGSTIESEIYKPCQIKVDDEHLIAAYNEKESAVCIYSVNSLNKIQSLESQENAVLDLCPFSVNCNSYLAALSKNRLKVYKTC